MAITYEQALIVARDHLSSKPLRDPNCHWVPGEPIEDGWYFRYTYKFDVEVPRDQWHKKMLFGAPGFIVGADGIVRVMGKAEWSRRKHREG